MGTIYEKSYVTIAATDSGDGNSRCLVGRQRAVKITYQNTTGKDFAIRARKVASHHPTQSQMSRQNRLDR